MTSPETPDQEFGSITYVDNGDHKTSVYDQTIDLDLSYKALGVLLHVARQGNGYRASYLKLSQERPGHEGRESCRLALKELRQAGLLRTVRKQDQRGRWASESVLYAKPYSEVELGMVGKIIRASINRALQN